MLRRLVELFLPCVVGTPQFVWEGPDPLPSRHGLKVGGPGEGHESKSETGPPRTEKLRSIGEPTQSLVERISEVGVYRGPWTDILDLFWYKERTLSNSS